MKVEICFPNDVTYPTPDGPITFLAGVWTYYKPKWAVSLPMDAFIIDAHQRGVKIRDWNLEEHDTSLLNEKDARDLFIRVLAWLARLA